MSSDSLESLREALRTGDPEAYRGLVRQMSEPVFRYVRPMLGDDSLAQDVVQQTCINIYRQRARLAEQGSLRAYCFMIATNLVRDEKRRSRARKQRETSAAESAMRAISPQGAEMQALAVEAFEAAKRLPEELREVVLLRFGQGLTAAEAATALGIPEGTVRTRQRSALEKLRQKLLAASPLAAIEDPKLESALCEGSNALVPVPDSLVTNVEALVMASIGTKAGVSVGIVLLLVLLLLGGTGLLIGLSEYNKQNTDRNWLAGSDAVSTKIANEDHGRTTVKREKPDIRESNSGKAGSRPAAKPLSGQDQDGSSGRGNGGRLIVRVLVVNAVTSKPVADASVTLFDLPDEECSAVLGLADENGECDISLDGYMVLPAQAKLSAEAQGFDECDPITPAANGVSIIRLYEFTTVTVRIDESDCVPESAWLRQGGKSATERVEGLTFEFDSIKRAAVVTFAKGEIPAGMLQVCARWCGALLESEAFTINRGQQHEIKLVVPTGATLKVRVLGWDGLPLRQSMVEVTNADYFVISGRTNEHGLLVVSGLNPPEELEVELTHCEAGAFPGAGRQVHFLAATDVHEVVFDFTGCGIVDCDLSAQGKPADYLHIVALDGGFDEYVFLNDWDQDRKASGIYGLKPGAYRVVVTCHQGGKSREFEAEFEVYAMPTRSIWKMNLDSKQITVKIKDWRPGEKITGHVFYDGAGEPVTMEANERGEFVFQELLVKPFIFHAWCATRSSRFVAIKPDDSNELEIELVPAGFLQINARDPMLLPEGCVYLEGAEPSFPKVP
ncbi:partial ECF RNA polymerase sigma factor SigL, partial [Anaerolineae bacterium]